MAVGVDRPVAQPTDGAAAGGQIGDLGEETSDLLAVEVHPQPGRLPVERLTGLGVDQQFLEHHHQSLRIGVQAEAALRKLQR